MYRPRQKRDEPCRLLLEQTFPTTLADRLRDAGGVAAEFLSDIPQRDLPALSDAEGSAKAARLRRLIQSQAWTDAALAFIDLELPQWQVRRLSL